MMTKEEVRECVELFTLIGLRSSEFPDGPMSTEDMERLVLTMEQEMIDCWVEDNKDNNYN